MKVTLYLPPAAIDDRAYIKQHALMFALAHWISGWLAITTFDHEGYQANFRITVEVKAHLGPEVGYFEINSLDQTGDIQASTTINVYFDPDRFQPLVVETIKTNRQDIEVPIVKADQIQPTDIFIGTEVDPKTRSGTHSFYLRPKQ